MSRSRSMLRTILTAGLVAGTLDILDAILFYQFRSRMSAEHILQFVASGLLGRAAFSGGWPVAMFGLLMHFTIAICWAALFVFLARHIPALKQHAVTAGIIYGFFVYAMMTFVIVPHTKAASGRLTLSIVLFNAVCAIVFLIGLPIALINRKLA